HRLARDGSGEKLEETLQTIAQLKDAPGIRLQIRLLADSRDAVQGRAKQMLDAQGTAGLDELVRAMADPDPRISFVAARRVSELGERGLPMLMRNATSSPDPIVRQACFKAIASIGLGAAREAVARGLTDPVAEVRREALQAASRIPAGEYASTIPQLLEQEPKETHLLAVEVAGQAQIGQAVPVLLRQIEAGHPNSVRILWALGRIGDQRALSVLAAKARSPESFTRQIAVTALGGLPGEQAMQVLMEAMLDPDPMVRMAAEKALSTPGR
ncbi:MAG: hypothetical protein FJ125_09440, partial [Deltaproteobacteria bacterium]|nr:hypothetical protein [Deltaproteobacteria bacterium]